MNNIRIRREVCTRYKPMSPKSRSMPLLGTLYGQIRFRWAIFCHINLKLLPPLFVVLFSTFALADNNVPFEVVSYSDENPWCTFGSLINSMSGSTHPEYRKLLDGIPGDRLEDKLKELVSATSKFTDTS